MSAPSVLVLDAPVREPLRDALGPRGADDLRAVLLERARRWGEAVAPGRVSVVADRAALPAAVESAAGDGPVLVITTDVPKLGPEHAAGALEDLAAGADVVYGSALDGGWYLLGLSAPQPEVLAGVQSEGGDVLSKALALASELGLEFGLLRHERRLGTLQDAAALLADPLVSEDVRAVLRRTNDGGGRVSD